MGRKPKRCEACGGAGFTLGLTGTQVVAIGCENCGGRPPSKKMLKALIEMLLAGRVERRRVAATKGKDGGRG